MTFTAYVLPLVASIGIFTWLALKTYRYRKLPAAQAFLILITLSAAWTFFYALKISVVSFELKVALHHLQLVPALFLAPSIGVLALRFVRQDQWLTRGNLAILLLIPLLALVGLLTSSYHTLFHGNFRLDNSLAGPVLLSEKGPLFWVFMTYSVLLNVSTFLFVLKFLNLKTRQGYSALLVFIGFLLPMASNHFALGFTLIPGFNMTGIAMLLAGVIFRWTMFRFDVFDATPIAQQMVFDAIEDAVIVLDPQNLLVEMNPAAQTYLGRSHAEAVGQKADTLHPDWRALFQKYAAVESLREEVVVKSGDNDWVFDLSISTIRDPYDQPQGRLFLLRNITARKRAEEALLLHFDARYRSLFDGAPIMYITTTHQKDQPMIREANQLFLDTLGYTREEVIGRPLVDFYSPESARALLSGGYQSALENNFPQSERQLVTRDGTMIYTILSAMFDTNETGDVTGIRAMFLDITERKKAEEALEDVVRQRQRLLELSMEMLVTQPMDEAIQTIFASLEQLVPSDLGFLAWCDEKTKTLRPEHFFGKAHIIQWVKEQSFPLGKGGIMNLVIETGNPELINDAHLDPRVVHPQGRRAEHEHAIAVPIRVSRKNEGVLCIIRLVPEPFQQDEFELVQLFVALAGIVLRNARLYSEIENHVGLIEQQRNDLRAVSARMQTLQETERRQISSELHDRVGQNLTALGININILQALIESGQTRQVQSRLNDSQVLLSDTAALVRDVMAELRPPGLDDFGLLVALQQFGKDMERRTGVKILVQGNEPETRLSIDQETALFRIAQEAVNNTIKHARAGKIALHLSILDEEVVLSIQDNGVGFVPHTAARQGEPGHWGLLTMKERAFAVGGSVEIQSTPGEGTCVHVRIRRQ